MFAIVVVMFISLFLMHAQVIVPLADLLQCARRVRVGDFSVRARHSGEDELGQLGQSFNYMVEDLARSYATLEARVEEKTEQLARTNVSLEVLYNTTRTLAENPLTQAARRCDARHRAGHRTQGGRNLRARENDRRGFPSPSTPAANKPVLVPAGTLLRVFQCGRGRVQVRIVGSGEERMLSVPLSEGGKPYGVMLLQLPSGIGSKSGR